MSTPITIQELSSHVHFHVVHVGRIRSLVANEGCMDFNAFAR